jgi:hypothetical protein
VILTKKVKVKYMFEVEVEVPFSTDEYGIKFRLEENADTSLEGIEDVIEDIKNTYGHEEYVVDFFTVDVIDANLEGKPYRRNEKGDIVPS